MLTIILFGVVVLACAVLVVRLARAARIDADSEQDVFEPRARQAEANKPVRRVEPATVRFAPVTIRRDRDNPTVPAMSR
ncbi:MAG TPA: hypothetical protein VG247_16490 [Pseudonocardiaceae bacterium]|nr:hypothetical protein [Pseudonocardiaceae bacterium]